MILILIDIPVHNQACYWSLPHHVCVGAHGIFCGKRQTIFFIVADETKAGK
jgi:hypothetical protein